MSFYKNKALKITCIVSLINDLFCLSPLFKSLISKQIKFGATYMTMNNTIPIKL